MNARNRIVIWQGLPIVIVVALAAVLAGGAVAFAMSSSCGSGQGCQHQHQAAEATCSHGGGEGGDSWQIRQNYHQAIHMNPDLTAAEQRRMAENLDACLDLNLSETQLNALFPSGRGNQSIAASELLRVQDQVIAVAREGLPVEPMVEKVQEGGLKGVQGQSLEHAVGRMGNHLRTAHRVMADAVTAGVGPALDVGEEQRLTREMARSMSHGVDAGGLEHLRDQARMRAHDGGCSLAELTAAATTASMMHGEGVDVDRAVHMTGEALRMGYAADEMMNMGQMMMDNHRQGGALEEIVTDLEYCLADGMHPEEMTEHMMQEGWMGPGDMHGPGGHHMIDDMGGGGPGHHGDMGDGGHHGGGMGDDDHDGGGMGDDDHGGGMGGGSGGGGHHGGGTG